MGMNEDTFANVGHLALYGPSATVTTGTEGAIVDVTDWNGLAFAVLMASETASIANSKKLDVTIHNVLTDADAADSDNKVGTFTQIVGANESGIEILTPQIIPIYLNRLPVMTAAEKLLATNFNKPYLQV